MDTQQYHSANNIEMRLFSWGGVQETHRTADLPLEIGRSMNWAVLLALNIAFLSFEQFQIFPPLSLDVVEYPASGGSSS
jgi:hypothetical protein